MTYIRQRRQEYQGVLSFFDRVLYVGLDPPSTVYTPPLPPPPPPKKKKQTKKTKQEYQSQPQKYLKYTNPPKIFQFCTLTLGKKYINDTQK